MELRTWEIVMFMRLLKKIELLEIENKKMKNLEEENDASQFKHIEVPKTTSLLQSI
jgi:hypothetical protein